MDKRKTSKKKTMLEKKTQGNAQLLGDRDIHACNTNPVYIIYMYIFFFTSKRPSLYHCNSCWLRHRCAPVIVTNITYVGNFTFTVATPAFNTMDPNHHTIAYRYIVFNFYILLWGRVIKYTMIINMNLSRLEWYTCVSYYSKKWQITQEMIYVATARWNEYWNIYVIYHTLSSD